MPLTEENKSQVVEENDKEIGFENGEVTGVPDLLFDAIKQLDAIKAGYIAGKNLVDGEILRIFDKAFPVDMENRPTGLYIQVDNKKLVAIYEQPETAK